eukprot:5842191-Amphidinium_carterae.1
MHNLLVFLVMCVLLSLWSKEHLGWSWWYNSMFLFLLEIKLQLVPCEGEASCRNAGTKNGVARMRCTIAKALATLLHAQATIQRLV